MTTPTPDDELRRAIKLALGGYEDDQFIDDCLRNTHTVDKLLALFRAHYTPRLR